MANYNQTFTFQAGVSIWTLPSNYLAQETPPTQDEHLYQLKSQLNSVKEKLSGYEINQWRKHTANNNPASQITRHVSSIIHPKPFCTNAWCKFYELITTLRLVDDLDLSHPLTAVHLCEAPGGFICALNHYLISNYRGLDYRWFSNTLNPYHENNGSGDMIPDDRLIKLTYDRWLFGADNTGDITSVHNMDDIVHTMKEKSKVIQLVTGDGSTDCQLNPAEQEMLVYPIILSELITSVRLLSAQGSAVIKMFTFFEVHTIALLFAVNVIFQKVRVHKPVSSKPGNSEVYLVCTGLKPMDPATFHLLLNAHENQKVPLFSLDSLPGSFLTQVRQCAEYFGKLQEETILYNIQTYKTVQTARELHMEFADEFCAQMKLAPIDSKHSVTPRKYHQANNHHNLASGLNFYGTDTKSSSLWQPRKRKLSGNFTERCQLTQEYKRSLILESSLYPEQSISALYYSEINCPFSHTPLDSVQLVQLLESTLPVGPLTNSCFCNNTLLSDYLAVTSGEDNSLKLCQGDCTHTCETVTSKAMKSVECYKCHSLDNEPQNTDCGSPVKNYIFSVEGVKLSMVLSIVQKMKLGDNLLVINVNSLLRKIAGCIFLLWHCFDEVAIVSHSSCGLPSVIFKRLIVEPSEASGLASHLSRAMSSSHEDLVIEIVPAPVIHACARLHAFLCDINNEALRRAINNNIRENVKNTEHL